MPGDPFKPVRPGDDLSIPAAAWSELMAMAAWWKAHRNDHRPSDRPPPPWPPGLVEVKNATGTGVPRWCVLGIDGPLFPPADAPFAFAERPRLVGVDPTDDHVGGLFVVLLEPAADGAVVLAAAGGVTVCKVNVSDAGHRFADVEAGESTALASAESGPVHLLWVEPGTGDGKWAVGRFGGGGGPSTIRLGEVAEEWEPGTNTVKLNPLPLAEVPEGEEPPDPIAVVIEMPPGGTCFAFDNAVGETVAYAELPDPSNLNPTIRFLVSYRQFPPSPVADGQCLTVVGGKAAFRNVTAI